MSLSPTIGHWRWYAVMLPDAAKLTAALRAVEIIGHEVFSVSYGPGGILLTSRILVTSANKEQIERLERGQGVKAVAPPTKRRKRPANA